ncbi:hypothetical protein ACJRPK_13700 [Aquimarina sp. 2-A2]|uniref:hypothetical protein n=1 Tax=Aquimarina sp. 2-A2 TaxID=3382644 RepID=UPI00387EEA90
MASIVKLGITYTAGGRVVAGSNPVIPTKLTAPVNTGVLLHKALILNNNFSTLNSSFSSFYYLNV